MPTIVGTKSVTAGGYMSAHLLLGAGFSRNWQGWLATDVAEYLLGCSEIEADPALQSLLADNAGTGFEAALEQVQNEFARNPDSAECRRRLNAMQTAVSRMFDTMNRAFLAEVRFESHTNRTGTIREFLGWFDAIFTLNQDVLLEHHYLDNFDVSLESPRRWDAVQIPGMRRIPNQEPRFSHLRARSRWQPMPDCDYQVAPNCQPLFKLHGSSNWSTSDGAPLLIIGGGKVGQIRRHPILRRYETEFRNRVCAPGRLVIIGYGFQDQHINKVIVDAVYQHGVKLFIIDTAGRALANVLTSPTLPQASMTVYGYDLPEVFKHGSARFSKRPLKEIFGGSGPDYEMVRKRPSGHWSSIQG